MPPGERGGELMDEYFGFLQPDLCLPDLQVSYGDRPAIRFQPCLQPDFLYGEEPALQSKDPCGVLKNDKGIRWSEK